MRTRYSQGIKRQAPVGMSASHISGSTGQVRSPSSLLCRQNDSYCFAFSLPYTLLPNTKSLTSSGVTDIALRGSPPSAWHSSSLPLGKSCLDSPPSNFHHVVPLVSSPSLCPCGFVSVLKSLYSHLHGVPGSQMIFKFQLEPESSS